MEISIRRCPSCKQPHLADVDICPACPQVTETHLEKVDSAGKIYSFTRVHVAPEEFKGIVPYYLAIVELDAGPRLLSRLKTVDGDHVRIDAPVECVSAESGYVFALK